MVISKIKSACGGQISKILILIIITALLTIPVYALQLISTQDEINIGRDVCKQLESKYGLYNNPAQLKRINYIGKKIVNVCDRKELPYKFKILNTKEVNALCAPGGFVYVTKGLLDLKITNDELACILGHEVTHAVKRHSAKQIETSLGISVVLSILTKGESQQQLAYQIAQTLVERGYSREDEFEADRIGVEYAYKAKYDPWGMVKFLKRLEKLKKEGYTFLDQFFSTHPPTADRISRLEEIIPTL